MNNKEPKTMVEEFRERLSREELERLWLLEAFDYLFTESGIQDENFHHAWIQPLLAEGLSLESALALLIESHFRPN